MGFLDKQDEGELISSTYRHSVEIIIINYLQKTVSQTSQKNHCQQKGEKIVMADLISVASMPPISLDDLLECRNLDLLERVIEAFNDGAIELKPEDAKKLADRSLILVDNYAKAIKKLDIAESHFREQVAELEKVARTCANAAKSIRSMLTYISLGADRPELYGATYRVKRVDTEKLQALSDPTDVDFLESPELISPTYSWAIEKPTPEIIAALSPVGLDYLVKTRFTFSPTGLEKAKEKPEDFAKWFTKKKTRSIRITLNKRPAAIQHQLKEIYKDDDC